MKDLCKKITRRIAFITLIAWMLASVVSAADLAEIKQNGVLRHIGIPYANFVTGSGDGLDVEILQQFAKSIGVQYEFVKSDWTTVVEDLIGKKVKVNGSDVEIVGNAPIRGDVIGNGFTVLPWRQKIVLFSEPIFPTQIWLVARADSPIKPIKPTRNISEDIERTRSLMKGLRIFAVENTCLDPRLYNLQATGAEVINYKGQLNEIAPAILRREADLAILDVPDALIALEKWPGKIKIIGPISPRQEMATAFRKDAPAMLKAYNQFLRKIKADGTYMKLVNKYYPSVKLYFPDFFAGKNGGK
jgi:ABC-type amino acid transport substrate-binding protein